MIIIFKFKNNLMSEENKDQINPSIDVSIDEHKRLNPSGTNDNEGGDKSPISATAEDKSGDNINPAPFDKLLEEEAKTMAVPGGEPPKVVRR